MFNLEEFLRRIKKHEAFKAYSIGKIVRETSRSVIVEYSLSHGLRKEPGLLQLFWFERMVDCDALVAKLENVAERLSCCKGVVLPVVQQIDSHSDGVFDTCVVKYPSVETAQDSRFREKDVAYLGSCIALALNGCHNAGILHRNIKPECIHVAPDGSYLLGRFESCGRIDDASTSGRTPIYVAPELYRGRGGIPTDIFALGMTMYALLKQNRSPVAEEGNVTAEMLSSNIQNIRSGISLPAINGVSSDLMSIVLKACHPDCNQRYSNTADLQYDLNSYLKKHHRVRNLVDIERGAVSYSSLSEEIMALLRTQTDFGKEWDIVSLLGKGGFGYVFKVVGKKKPYVGQEMAAKIIPVPHMNGFSNRTPRQQAESVMREIKFQSEFADHPNVVRVVRNDTYRRADDKDKYFIAIIMELLVPINHMRMDERQVIAMGIDVCSALSDLHKRKDENHAAKIHRDIKPENIMYSSQTKAFKLGDFGIMREVTGSLVYSRPGSPPYKAPEVETSRYDHRVDIYSLGLTIYALCNRGRLPYMDVSQPITQQQVDMSIAKRRRFDAELLPSMAEGSDALLQVVSKACRLKPRDRYATADEMKKALEALL